MNPARLRPRVASQGRVSVRLNPSQRDLLARSHETSRELAHALRKAPVREGKLTVRVSRHELESLVAAAAAATAPDRRAERDLNSLLRYLEDLEDRFAEPADDSAFAGDDESDLALHSREHEEHGRAGMSET